jgi:hypothetical protein
LKGDFNMQFTFRTTPPATYISPSKEEMKAAAQKVGLSSYSRDLVADLCNLGAGGRVNAPSEYRNEIRRRADEALPAPDQNGAWRLASGSVTKNRSEVIAEAEAKAMKYHQAVADFLDSVDLSKFPGGSPLEQAMSMLKLLSKQQGGQGGGEAGEPLPIFQDTKTTPEKVAKDLNGVMDEVDSLSEDEQDMLDPDGKNHDVQKSTEGDGQQSGSKGLDRLKVAEDLVPGSDKRVMLDISRKLDQFTKLQVRKQRLVEVDPAGEEVRQRPMKNLGELARVSKSAWAARQQNPNYFLYQAITGQLAVRERVTQVERKQALFILIDGSGSMRGSKHWKATGVVMNRLKAVLSGDAEVFVSVFDTSLGRVDRASTPEEARAVIKKFAAGNFKGGGTDISGCTKAAHKYMEELITNGEALYRPEIVVLTDEDSSVQGLKRSDLPGTRFHGFAMEVKNKSLVDFAKSTGGVGIDKF